MPRQPLGASLGDLRVKLDTGEVSSEELARQALAGLDRVARPWHLVAALVPERAIEEAARADELIRAGNQSFLTGIPYGVKDQLAAVGAPTAWGSAIYEDQRFDYDATAVARLRQAGAVLVGKLSMMELGGAGGYRSAAASASGPAGNPWHPGHWAGGSSGGSAAVVGAGLLPYSLAGDSLGSIILPAAFCGVTGLRPTFGAISRFGSMPGSWTLGKVGVIARSAADCDVVFQAVAGEDPNDPMSRAAGAEDLPQRPYRIGVLPPEAAQPPAVGDLMQSALQVLKAAGMSIVEVSPPDRDYIGLAKRIRAAEVVAAHEEIIRDPDLLARVVDEQQREGLRAFLRQPLSAYPRAAQEREYARQEILRLFDEVDFLVTPSVVQEAPSFEDDLSDQPFRHSTHMAMGALADLPGLSVPIGFGEAGLPIGMTVVGRPFVDRAVMDAARQYQAATDWHLRIPESPGALLEEG